MLGRVLIMDLHLELRVVLFMLNALLGVILCDQNGFLSLSCGGTTTYVDSLNITWIPDDDYINDGQTTTIDSVERASSSEIPIRFFPDARARNCYKLPVTNVSSPILVRARFLYQNYDGLNSPPVFSVSFGRAMSRNINLSKADPWTEEVIWPASKDPLPVCLHSIPNGGHPVISSLEVRTLPAGAYTSSLNSSEEKFLRKSYRLNCGFTNGSLRYPVDPYDRVWDADEDFSSSHLSTPFQKNSSFNTSSLSELPPVAVLQTARLLRRKNGLSYDLPLDMLGDYYTILYFAGILPFSPMFNILANGDIVESNYTVNSGNTTTVHFTKKYISTLNITLQSISFHPQVNAVEVFQIVDIPPETSSTTVLALEVVQQSTGLDLGWEEDPCFPRPWKYIGCAGNLVTSVELYDMKLRSISPAFGDLLDLRTLDLHNTSLEGEIMNLDALLHIETLNLSFNSLISFGTDLGSLVNLQVLDLQSNSLKGTIPQKLGELQNLHLLNLENNELRGPLPQSLHRDSLILKASGNLCLSSSTSVCSGSGPAPTDPPLFTIVPQSNHTDHMHIKTIIGAVGGGICSILLIASLIFFYMRKNTAKPAGTVAEIRNWNAAKVFSYKEIKAATRNFKEVIGQGSFGSVYLGKFPDGKMVAVKVRFDDTQIGADSFLNEVSLLSQIRHQNLVSLEGFCHDSKQQILVYEYLAGGSLADSLYGTNSKKINLNWIRRLKIATDAAKGLQYLHNGSEPRIIHRDVKCSNILLDAQMNAKVSDFGLSKQLAEADATHVTTVVKGTAGYLDPEYYSTLQLTEKSDIYSFGVVLLELICGREPFTRTGTPDTYNLVLWAKPYLQAGMFEIVDDTLTGNFDMESMKKVSDIASRCVDRDASIRPTITEVLRELQEAYSLQLAYLASTGLVH